MIAAPELALQASGLGQAEHQSAATPAHLLSDNGPSYLAADLSDWLDSRGMPHIRGKPNHPMTQARSGRWPLSLKSKILLENYYLPGELQGAIADFVDHYNHRRYHERLDNLTPADVNFGVSSASSTCERRSATNHHTNAAKSTLKP